MKAIVLISAAAFLFLACGSPTGPGDNPPDPPAVNRLLAYGTVTDRVLQMPIPNAFVSIQCCMPEISWQINAGAEGVYKIEIDNPDEYLNCYASALAWVDGYELTPVDFQFTEIPMRVDLSLVRETE